MKIYGDTRSGNCLKVLYTARKLLIPHDWVDVDIMSGGAKTPEFLAVNPSGQVPAVTLDDGRSLGQSNAIILYLARGTDLLPTDPYDRAKVDEWLFWEQYSHEPYVAVCRFNMVYEGKPADQREPWRVTRGEAALDRMEDHLKDREWLAGEALSVADISLFG